MTVSMKAILNNTFVTQTDSIHRIGQDSHWQQFGTIHILINAIYWLHRPCSASSLLDRVKKKLSMKADLAIYTHMLGLPGQC